MNEEKKDAGDTMPLDELQFDWNNRDHTLSFINGLCKRVEKKRNATKALLFKSILRESRDLVLQQAQQQAAKDDNTAKSSELPLPLLPSHTNRFVSAGSIIGSYEHKARLLQAKNKKWQTHQVNEPAIIEGININTERPTAKTTVFLKSNYVAEDQENLTFAPYFGDDDDNDAVLDELFDTSKRQELLDSGPEHVEEQRNEFIDEVLTCTIKEFENRRKSTRSTRHKSDLLNLETIMFRVQDHIACVKGYDHVHIRQRYTLKFESIIFEMMYRSKYIDKQNIAMAKKTVASDNDNHNDNDNAVESMSMSMVKNSDLETDEHVEYGDLMDSYRHLFCRQCFVYDCNKHGVMPKSNDLLPLQTTLAIRKEKEGGWRDEQEEASTSIQSHLNVPQNPGTTTSTSQQDNINEHKQEGQESSSEPKKLTTLQRVVCQHIYQVYNGDVNKMAIILNCDTESIQECVNKMKLKVDDHDQLFCQFIGQPDKKNKKKKRKCEGAMNNYDQAWLRRVEAAEIFPEYLPCDHIEPCSEETCSCAQNAFFCTKYCVWGCHSKYFFQGCRCKRGECQQKSCPCFAAGKECDPDLCSECGACVDEPNKPATTQRCRNDNIGMRRHCQLLVAPSRVKEAGWGVYNKTALKKDDLVHEYLGEIISQEEADRRGCIYDKVNRSFLFNLTSDRVVDANRKGNKTRFLNHDSRDPNCYTKILNVGGNARIGIFAKEEIHPQTELFFDYRYDVGMNNDLIEKPAIEVEWMKKKKAKKKHA